MGNALNYFRSGVTAVAVLFSAAALGHGDVTPHPIDTKGLKALGSAWLPENPYRGDKAAFAIGAEGYLHNCAGCHGLNAVTGGVAPDLLLGSKDCLGMSGSSQAACLKDSDDYFKERVLKGKIINGKVNMPAYESVFTQEAVWALKTYIDTRTEQAAKGN